MNHPLEPGRRRLSPVALAAALISIFALTVALSSTATAALMVGSNQIKKNAVKSKHIKKNAVTTSDIKDGTIKPRDLAPATRNRLAGAQGEKGDPGISGYQVVEESHPLPGANAPDNPSNFSWIVACPSGTTALAAGHAGPKGIQMAIDRPGANGQWLFSGQNFHPTTGTLRLYVTCAVVAP